MSTDLHLSFVHWPSLVAYTDAYQFSIDSREGKISWNPSVDQKSLGVDLSTGSWNWWFGDDWLKVHRKIPKPLRDELQKLVADITMLKVGLPFPRDWQPKYREVDSQASSWAAQIITRRGGELTEEQRKQVSLYYEVSAEKSLFSYSPERIQRWMETEAAINWTDVIELMSQARRISEDSRFSSYKEWGAHLQEWKAVFRTALEVPDRGLIVRFYS